MKFVCRTCEAFMLFDEVEGIREDSLGVTFGCPNCGVRVSMVTNAGETQIVRTLGVQLGGRSEAATPLELARTSLVSAVPLPKTGGQTPTQPAAEVAWTPEAKERLERVPDFVRAFAKTMIEDMARQDGSNRVDGSLMDRAKERFM